MIRKIALGIFLVFIPLNVSPSLAGDEIVEQIERFMKILETNPNYYISREYDLYGEGEMYIGERLCGEDLKLSINEKTLCAELRSKRFQEDSDVPSLLLLWLRTKLPKDPAITVLKVEWMQRYAQHQIKVRLDDTLVVFNLFNMATSYNPMDIQSINGVNLIDLIDEDIRNGLSISTLLNKIKKD